MIAYRSSSYCVRKCSPVLVVLGNPPSLPVDFIYSTPLNTVDATTSDYVFTMKQKLQQRHRLMREVMVVKQESQKLIMTAVSMD